MNGKAAIIIDSVVKVLFCVRNYHFLFNSVYNGKQFNIHINNEVIATILLIFVSWITIPFKNGYL